jgi:FAD/FMN-containing dehydrogenase
MGNLDRDRRKFIKTVAYAGGTLFAAGAGVYFLFKDSDTSDRVQTELTRHLKGKVLRDNLLIEEYRSDFGRTIRKEPRVIVVPKDDHDITTTFKIAAEYQVPVSIRGAGHTCYGQSLSDGGILLVNYDTNPNVKLENGIVSAHTKTRWMELEQIINRYKLTSPVLTDYLELTVGGTISVGGYGLRSFQYGAQVDNIIELEVILPSSQTLICNSNENSDLFRYTLCGLGQLGFVSKVKFKSIPYRQHTLVFYIMCRSIKEFLSTLKNIFNNGYIDSMDHFSAYWVNGTFFIEIGSSFDEKNSTRVATVIEKIEKRLKYYKKTFIKDYHLYLHNVRKQWVEQYGISHHLWEDYIFSTDELEEFLNRTIATDNIQQQLKILPALYLMACNSARSKNIPFSPTFGRSNEMVYSVGFYYMVKLGDTDNLNSAKKQLEDNMKHCIDIGGRPYLYGWHGLSESQKVQVYHDDYIKLRKLKQKYDPHHLLNPGVFIT